MDFVPVQPRSDGVLTLLCEEVQPDSVRRVCIWGEHRAEGGVVSSDEARGAGSPHGLEGFMRDTFSPDGGQGEKLAVVFQKDFPVVAVGEDDLLGGARPNME